MPRTLSKLLALTFSVFFLISMGAKAQASESTQLVPAVQEVKSSDGDIETAIAAEEDTVRRQMTRLVRKNKTSSDIGYPATSKVSSIQSYRVVEQSGSVYEIKVSYLVVASVDTAKFEDVFVMELNDDGSIEVLELLN